ncbi:hypothetical protein LSH36_32g13030 [Paralvinella palmiformis]|uniref:RRM domain-containing protein n=1 Tax=Paralvinella palmiformis TaxID=53620 RepID=A0AAD9NH88_9ANNE|nr:hypothetical protein LSH36_32g13030 [Paralvinella palmiformis]
MELSEDLREVRKKEVKSKCKKNRLRELKTGIIYLSRIPTLMNVKKIREIFSQYGDIGRIFLQPNESDLSCCSTHYTSSSVPSKSLLIEQFLNDLEDPKPDYALSIEDLRHFFGMLDALTFLPLNGVPEVMLYIDDNIPEGHSITSSSPPAMMAPLCPSAASLPSNVQTFPVE